VSVEAISEARQAPRTNTMLAASLEFGGERHPVFVRNLSATGAMVEGKLLPLAGDDVVLHRDQQSIVSQVAWVANNRCGLAFGVQVKVDALIKRAPGAIGPAPAHQARVDAIQRALRDKSAVPSFTETEALVGAGAVGKRLVDEIGYAHRLVDAVNDALSNDGYVLARHAVILQQLDEAEQLLRKLNTNLSAESAPGRC
jgi:hypothetical protein